MYPEHVTTERLSLQRWVSVAHAPALTTLNAVPAVVRFLNDSIPYTADQSRAQSERFALHWATYGFGLWAVELEGSVVGFAGAAHPMWLPQYAHEVEVGWRLHPSVWGNGYATEAGRAAIDAALTHLGLARIIACIDPANTASIAVASRLGMTVGETVAHPQQPGSLHIYESRCEQFGA